MPNTNNNCLDQPLQSHSLIHCPRTESMRTIECIEDITDSAKVVSMIASGSFYALHITCVTLFSLRASAQVNILQWLPKVHRDHNALPYLA